MLFRSEKKLAGVFEGELRLTFHLAPPLLAKLDPVTGAPKKMKFGPWMMSVFRVLAKMKGLRGTSLDPFGRTEERRTERALIEEYEHAVNALLDHLSRDNHALALEIAANAPLAIQAALARRHIEEMLSFYGSFLGLLNARKHIGWYLESSGHREAEIKDWRRRL